ncbi:MAG: ribonuclease Z [Verrucomicrobia bacterium]|nr:ribonuclease Z [Verrucomicrobiota bacterium]
MSPTSNPVSTHRLTCLGVGEGWPSGSRRHASFVYQFGSTRLLLDCGDGMSSAFKAAGFDYESLDAIVLSHMHSDHVGGFSMFIQSLWLNQRRRPLPVYAPARALPALQAWLNATVLPAGLIGFELQWRGLEPGGHFNVGPVQITAHPTTHLDSLQRSFGSQLPATAFEAFSFVLRDSQVRVSHTADIGDVSDTVPLLAVQPNLFVSELSHVDLPALTAAIRQAQPSKVIFVHVACELLSDLDGLQARLKQELGPIPFALARDDDAFDF